MGSSLVRSAWPGWRPLVGPLPASSLVMISPSLDGTGPSSSAYSASLPLVTLQRWGCLEVEGRDVPVPARRLECYHHHEKQSCWEGALGTSF